MSEDVGVKFWTEWEKSGDSERVEKVKALVRVVLIPELKRVFPENDAFLFEYCLADPLNGYFEDLKHYLEEEKRK